MPVIPGVNDAVEVAGAIAGRIVADLGPDVPWHLTRYHPAYRFSAPPTPVSTLERAWRMGKEAGLRFVYLGNVPGHEGNHTFCHNCRKMLVERQGYHITRQLIAAGRCPYCNTPIPGVWA